MATLFYPRAGSFVRAAVGNTCRGWVELYNSGGGASVGAAVIGVACVECRLSNHTALNGMFSKLEQRTWIKIEVARGKNARECHSGLREACGNEALPYRTVAR